MAGIAALIDQKLGAPQGNLNPALYRLAATTPDVFHDVTVASSGIVDCDIETPSMCNNSTPSPSALTGGLAGFEVGPGYDLATGLGSIDAANLVDALARIPPSFALSSSGSITVARGGVSGNTAVISVTPSAGFTGTVSLSCAVTTAPPGAQSMPTCSIPDAVTVSGPSPATATLAVLTAAAGAMLSLPGAGSVLACACLFAVPRRRRARLGVLALLLAGIVSTVGCGDGDSPATATISYSPPGTTPGTYVVTVTGASGSFTSTTTVPVTVN